MPSEGRRDFPLRQVTPDSGQGALGTWRAARRNTTFTVTDPQAFLGALDRAASYAAEPRSHL